MDVIFLLTLAGLLAASVWLVGALDRLSPGGR